MQKTVNDDMKLANILPPLFICINMATIWSVYVWLHLLPMLQIGIPIELRDARVARRGLHQTIISQVLVLLFLICFVRAILTSPGTVPSSPAWSMGGAESKDAPTTREVKVTGERRHCKWCLKYKPDRCHHCRICKTCVLKMDHHCPWIMNCVGWGNHKFFFLLVVYAVSATVYHGTTVLASVQASVNMDMPHFNRFLLVLCLMLSFIMGSLMVVFLAFHTWLMLRGMTTIEYCEKHSIESSGQTYKGSPYDRSFLSNIKEVLGQNPIFWLLPFDRAIGDGINYKVRDAFEVNSDLPASLHAD